MAASSSSSSDVLLAKKAARGTNGDAHRLRCLPREAKKEDLATATFEVRPTTVKGRRTRSRTLHEATDDVVRKFLPCRVVVRAVRDWTKREADIAVGARIRLWYVAERYSFII